MIMTVVVASAIVVTSFWVTLELNNGFDISNESFGVYIGRD